jgi:hypothetical protein
LGIYGPKGGSDSQAFRAMGILYIGFIVAAILQLICTISFFIGVGMLFQGKCAHLPFESSTVLDSTRSPFF